MNTPHKPLSQTAVDPTASEPVTTAFAASTKKRELIYAVIGLVSGFVVLPCLIYLVGGLTLGPYAGGKSVWVFLGEFYNNMAHGALRTWFIALSPYLAFWVIRLSFSRRMFGGQKPLEVAADEATPAKPAQGTGRREPFISP